MLAYETLIPLLLGVILVFFNLSMQHYLGIHICVKCSRLNRHLFSFGAGFITVYLFVILIPDIFMHAYISFLSINAIAYVMMFGFILFLFLEHFVYKHVAKNKIKKDERTIHALFLFLFTFLEGTLLYALFQIDQQSAFLFFFVVLVVNMADDFSLHKLYNQSAHLSNLLMASAALLGIIFSIFAKLSASITTMLLAFFTGVLLYIVGTEFIPEEKHEHMAYFIIGIFVFTILQLMLGG